MKVLILPYVENFDIAQQRFPEIQFSKTYFKNIEFTFFNGDAYIKYGEFDCKDFDLVWLASHWGTRDLAYALDLYLSDNDIKHTKVEKSGSKVVDHMVFTLNNIPSPNTFFVNSNKIDNHIDKIESICKYPLVIKDIKGSQGKETFLVHNRQELLDTAKAYKAGIKYMYQQYIPNDFDWGVLVVNNKVVSTEKSFSKEGSFKNNACNGATEVFIDVDDCPDNVKQIAKDAALALGLNWCRADIIVDKNTNKPYLLEMNRYPGITKGTDEVRAVINYTNFLINEDYESA